MKKNVGFTTVELMVTLFVAGIFLISGYQLYGVVSDHVRDVREMSEASNIGYRVLRQQKDFISSSGAITQTCDRPHVQHYSSNILSQLKIEKTTLRNPSVEVQRCRPFADSGLLQVTVIVRYGADPQKEVVHATYAEN